MSEVQVRPIGVVRSELVDLDDAPRQGDEGAPDAWLVFQPDLVPGFAGLRRAPSCWC